MDIRLEFGQRVKELRSRSGMSQEMLAYLAELDRTYISGVERGERNISIVNIKKIASALRVSVAFLFSGEQFSTTPPLQRKDLDIPFEQRFHYHVDSEKKILSFQVKGTLTPQDVNYMDKTLMGVCSAFGKGELNLLVDHREMLAADGTPVVYSPEVAERAIIFQQNLLQYNKSAVVLCNSEFQVEQLNHVTQESGIPNTSLFDEDKKMVGKAYMLLDINGNELIKEMKEKGQ